IPGTKITVTANRTIKAVWKDQVVPNPVYYTVKLNLNGGKWNGNTGIVSLKKEEGTVITLPEPTRSGYTFDYWKGSRYEAGEEYTVTEDHTLTAQWIRNATPAPTPTPTPTSTPTPTPTSRPTPTPSSGNNGGSSSGGGGSSYSSGSGGSTQNSGGTNGASTPNTGRSGGPNTGDNGSIALWMVLLLISTAMLLFAVTYNRGR
ncbi:MAG: InlB B-repeat-containing protein, partial [Lachnospiraceae bacterium]|nr:InlB B-repeat-containing protein [Lachnospiraceae bacterium]